MSPPAHQPFRWSLFFLLIFFLGGCQPSGGDRADAPSRGGTGPGSRISLFLQYADGQRNTFEAVTLPVKGVEIGTGEKWLPLADVRKEARLDRMNNGQVLLARAVLPPGPYTELRLQLGDAICKIPGGANIPLPPAQESFVVPLPSAFTLTAGASETFLVRWSIDQAMQGGGIGPANMSVTLPPPPLVTDLLYAACPEVDTLYLVASEKNRVVGSVGVPGQPVAVALNQRSDRLWVLSRQPAAIHVFELSSLRRQDIIRLPMLREGTHMSVDPEANQAWVADEQGGTVVRLSLASGGIEARTRLSDRPSRTFYLPAQRQLAVATSLRDVVLLDAQTLEPRTKVSGARSPQGLAVYEDTLFITSRDEDTLLAYSLRTGQGRKVHLGRAPGRLLVHDRLLYAANSGETSVSVVLAGQLQPLRLLAAGKTPGEMAVSSRQRWLYVANHGGMGLAVLDLNTGQTVAAITLDTVPDALAAL